jgi:hypothetical protein
MINSWGMVDTEWWRAWMAHIQEVGIRNVYSNITDSSALFANLSNPILHPNGFKTFPDIHIPEFSANLYWRVLFPIAQPPIFYLDLLFVLFFKTYLGINSDYQILNMTNIFWSLILTFSFGLLLKKLNVHRYITYALLLIWVNPLFILQSNVQGYRDLLIVIFITLSLLFSQSSGKKPYFAGLFFGAACLTKPTALFLLPVLLLIQNKQVIRKMFVGSTFALLTTTAIYAYFQRLYGLTAAMLTEMSLANSWSEGISVWSPFRIIGLHSNYLPISTELIHPFITFLDRFRSHIGYFSALNFIGFLVIAALIRKSHSPDLFSPVVPLFVFLLYISNPSSRMNHYFVFIPIWLIGFTKTSTRAFSALILLAFFIQDFAYAGLGRNSYFDGTRYFPLINFILTFVIILLLRLAWNLKNSKSANLEQNLRLSDNWK